MKFFEFLIGEPAVLKGIFYQERSSANQHRRCANQRSTNQKPQVSLIFSGFARKTYLFIVN